MDTTLPPWHAFHVVPIPARCDDCDGSGEREAISEQRDADDYDTALVACASCVDGQTPCVGCGAPGFLWSHCEDVGCGACRLASLALEDADAVLLGHLRTMTEIVQVGR